MANYDANIASLSEALTNLQGRIQAKTNLNAEYKRQVVASLAQIEEKIRRLKVKMDSLRTELTQQQANSQASISQQTADHAASIQDLEQRLNAAETAGQNAATELAQARADADRLSNELATGQLTRDEIQRRVDALTQQLTAAQADVARLQGELNNSQTSMAEVQQSLERLNNAILAAIAQINAMISDSDIIIQDDLDSLGRNVTNVNDLLDEMLTDTSGSGSGAGAGAGGPSIFGNLFGQAQAPTQAQGPPVFSGVNPLANQGRRASGSAGSGRIRPPQPGSVPFFQPPQPRQAGRLGLGPAPFSGTSNNPGINSNPFARSGGRRTKRRYKRAKKTQRGGYRYSNALPSSSSSSSSKSTSSSRRKKAQKKLQTRRL